VDKKKREKKPRLLEKAGKHRKGEGKGEPKPIGEKKKATTSKKRRKGTNSTFRSHDAGKGAAGMGRGGSTG